MQLDTLVLVLPFALGLSAVALAAPLPQLKVSDNHRFLVTPDGNPFFWLGDTTWGCSTASIGRRQSG